MLTGKFTVNILNIIKIKKGEKKIKMFIVLSTLQSTDINLIYKNFFNKLQFFLFSLNIQRTGNNTLKNSVQAFRIELTS